jgi:hypothetical protein
MSDAPVVPEMKQEPKRSAPKTNVSAKKTVVGKKSAKTSITKSSLRKPERKVGKSSAKKAPAKKTAGKDQRKPFPYARVLKMWRAGKSSMEIAKAMDRYDSKAADPMHSFRVTLTRFHKGVRINGKVVKLPHRVSKKSLKLATRAGRKAVA